MGNLTRRTFLEVMGAACLIGTVGRYLPTGCASQRIVPIESRYTLQDEPRREELHAILAADYNPVTSAQQFLDQNQDYKGPIITLVESPNRNTGNQTWQLHEWNAMRYFTRLREEVGEPESYGEPLRWVYLNIGDDLNQTALGDLVIRNSHHLVDRPQIFLIGGGSESLLERGLASKTLNLDHDDVIPAVRRDAVTVRRKLGFEE